MKKKIAMRVASLALCVVFTASAFGAPKAKAVAVETAVGVAVVAAYFVSTGLVLSASAGSTGELVTAGVGKIVTDFCAAADHAGQTAIDFYADLVANTFIRPDGALALSAAAVVAIGELVAWYVGENGLTEEGSTAVAVPGTSDFCSYNGTVLSNIDAVWVDKDTYPFAILARGTSGAYYLHICSGDWVVGSSKKLYASGAHSYEWYKYMSDSNSFVYHSGYSYNFSSYYDLTPFWASFDLPDNSGSLDIVVGDFVPAGDVQNQLEVTRTPEFSQPDAELLLESKNQMVVDLGLSPGITLDDAVVEIPDRIAAGTFAPTYEITTTETGGGEGTETVPDEETGIYVPVLSDIKNAVAGLGTSIVSGVKELFVPDEAAVDSFSAQVDAKLPFIGTLQEFGDDFAYKLEHPEECANGLGLTTVVDLGKGRGSYLGTTKHDLLDVSWYLEYKPMVDDIIVGFCWLCFLWNCYGALPRIIHGEGSIAGAISILREEDGDL